MKRVRVTLQFKDKEKANMYFNHLKDKPAKVISINKEKLELVVEVEV